MASISASLAPAQVVALGAPIAATSTNASRDVTSFSSAARVASVAPLKAAVSRRVSPAVNSQRSSVRAMVATGADAVAAEAKEMERVAAKEALLLAVKDAGGVEALTSGKGNSAAKIEVSEKLLALERLNPTPRPTTSPLLEGTWDFVWAGTRSPGIIAARVLLKRFPQQLATLESLKIQILEGSTKATAVLKFLTAAEASVTVSTRLAVEGPLRLKEEYTEAVVSAPSVSDDSIPAALKGVFDQVVAATKSLPEAVKEAVASGLKVPLSGRFEREIVISYLDDELLVARDQSGLADVLVRQSVVIDSPFTEGDETEIDEPIQ
eukprot:TRINITY_DN4746_c0_g1_i1.p1 TRINITY_DN4746_c0_g1~~TRINITY_DN4746_c0_g1_i1.p1  ORF type:complete len:323 (+),score=36.52 TRINITY_DN4746_c0_g1_i1:126-1094(+)